MPFQTKSVITTQKTQLFQYICGAYFRQQRITQNISLTDAAKSLKINKGFLSDLERGNRPFPNGIIEQFNEFYLTNFYFDDSAYNEALNLLEDIYVAYAQTNQDLIIQKFKIVLSNKEKIDTYAFFIYQLLYFFYYIEIEENHEKADDIKNILLNNIATFTDEQISILYSLCGVLCLKKDNINEAENFFLISNEYCSKSSIMYALNMFYLITIYSKMNKCAYSLLFLNQTKLILSTTLCYSRIVYTDLCEAYNLIQLGLYRESNNLLLRILDSGIAQIQDISSYIYQLLAIVSLHISEFEGSINYFKKITDTNIKNKYIWIPSIAYYSLNNIKDLNLEIKNISKDSKNKTIDFLYAIEDRVENDYESFLRHILVFYSFILENHFYDMFSIVLHYILDFSKEKNDSKTTILALNDLDFYHENKLSITSSNLLKKK